MAEQTDDGGPLPLQDLTPEEASRIIHSHRKVRYGTACWPCRQRKVKCDNQHPCENCVKREHAQLCSYKPNRTKPGSVGVESPVSSRKRAHSDDGTENGTPTGQGPELWPKADDNTEAAEVSRYLGQNSIPALLREAHSPNELQSGAMPAIRSDIRSILGLDNSAPFPLMSSRHLDKLTQDIASELPSDREVMKLFRTYKDIPQPFWGFVIDIDDLESKLMVYLEDRAKSATGPNKSSKPVSATWLAILFAVLAVGSQYHDSPYHIRTRDSQKYIQISFHFLRIGNFLLRPVFDSIQALLLTAFVLLNDMKAEASWALIGMTCRLAQSLGLHRALPPGASTDPLSKDMVRRRLWWTCVWHDTLTSLSFDRPPMTNMVCCPIPLSPRASTDGWTYLEAMYHLCQIISQKLNPDATASATYLQILENCDRVESIRKKLQPQLLHKESCKTALDRLQHYAIRLHTSFVVSVCCRPALRRDGEESGAPSSAASTASATAPQAVVAASASAAPATSTVAPPAPTPSPGRRLESEQRNYLADRCKTNLTETVRMFLAMHQLSVIPTRSWAFTYHGLSSAVLLGLLAETKNDPEVRQLQGDLISALSATAAKDQTSPPDHIRKTDRDIELSGPLNRALIALRNIYDYGTVSGSSNALAAAIKKEIGTGGTATPQALAEMGVGALPSSATGTGALGSPLGASGGALAGNGGGASVLSNIGPYSTGRRWTELQQAVAMAEIQNGSGVPDYTGNIPYASMQPAMSIADMAALDASATMSPMDLYDSIFWESPDPWNNGMDALNFDFIAQPPPGQPEQQQFYF